MTIAIASIAHDSHATRVEQILRGRGQRVVRIDHTRFTRPATAAVR